MRIGILGYGSIGQRHGQNLIQLGHTIIIHDPALPESLPKDKVIEAADAVVISSPTSEHASDMLLCQRARKPCFVEKPISDHKLNSHGWPTWPLMVGYNMRFHPCVLKAKEWLNDYRLGHLLWANFICAQYTDKAPYQRDGVTLNWSHEIDLALHLLGAAEVRAAAINQDDSIADIILGQETQTSIHLDYVTRPEHRGFSIAGDKGVLIAALPQRSIVLLDTDGVVKQAEQYPGSYDDDYLEEMRHFCTLIPGTEAPNRGCTAEEAIEVLKICLKAKKMTGLK